jgi:hypothetical protein
LSPAPPVADVQLEDVWIKGKNIAIKLKSQRPAAAAFNCELIFKSEPLKCQWLFALLQCKSEYAVPLRVLADVQTHRRETSPAAARLGRAQPGPGVIQAAVRLFRVQPTHVGFHLAGLLHGYFGLPS